MAIPDDRIYDVKNQSEISIRKALETSIIRWFVANENTEYIYRNNSYIFGDNLYLIKYVLDPNDQKKLTLDQAFHRLILDDENHFYYGKKGPYPLESAIQKGFISCQTIDLNLLDAIIVSNVFKYSDQKINSAMDNNIHQCENTDESKALVNCNENENESDKNIVNRIDKNESDISDENADEVKQELNEEDLIQKREDQVLINELTEEEVKQKSTDEETSSQQTFKTETDYDYLPTYLKEKLYQTKPVPLLKKGFLPIEILEKTGIKYHKSKNYIITDVLDEYKKEFVPLKKALKMGILKKKTNEFIDSRNGNSMSVVIAIRKNKIKISEYKEKLVEIESMKPMIESPIIVDNDFLQEEAQKLKNEQEKEKLNIDNENEGIKIIFKLNLFNLIK